MEFGLNKISIRLKCLFHLARNLIAKFYKGDFLLVFWLDEGESEMFLFCRIYTFLAGFLYFC